MRRAWLLVQSALVVLGLIGILGSPASSHTALLEASPGPDQTVGGVVEGIDLAFLDPISDAIVTVSYNGAPVPGATTVSDGEVIRFQFDEPLQEVGRYQVFYEMTSFDLDYTTSGFFFTYAVDAPPANRIELPSAEDSSSFPIVPTVIGTTILVAALGLFVWQFDTKRRQAAAGDDGAGYDDGAYHDFDYGDGYADGHASDYADGYADGYADDDW